ncbi:MULTISPECIES: hypothetical protein [Polaromonas]|uniref:Uncharacterized protein n=1 Tax=Polaromonas aquatica TaxID=332657 RepID=A0ABW1TX31_9BURK
MTWTVEEFPLKFQRVLVLQSDNQIELDALIEKAKLKGWECYAEGTVPDTNDLSTWMLKSV